MSVTQYAPARDAVQRAQSAVQRAQECQRAGDPITLTEALIATADALSSAADALTRATDNTTGMHAIMTRRIAAWYLRDASAVMWDAAERQRHVAAGGRDPVRYAPALLPLEIARRAVTAALTAIQLHEEAHA